MVSDAIGRRHAPAGDVLDRLLDAAVAVVRDEGYPALTVRQVARRAGVSPATAYNYVSSKEHLLVSLFYRGLTEAQRPEVPAKAGPQERVKALVDGISGITAAEPALVPAYRAALLADDPDARRVRDAVARHLVADFRWALGEDFAPEAQEAVQFAFVGAMVMAGAGLLPFEDLGERLVGVVRLLTR